MSVSTIVPQQNHCDGCKTLPVKCWNSNYHWENCESDKIGEFEIKLKKSVELSSSKQRRE